MTKRRWELGNLASFLSLVAMLKRGAVGVSIVGRQQQYPCRVIPQRWLQMGKHLKLDKAPSCHSKLNSPFKTKSQLAYHFLGFSRQSWSFPNFPDPEDHLDFSYPAESYLQEVLIQVIGQIQWLVSVYKKRRGCTETRRKLGSETGMELSQANLEVLAWHCQIVVEAQQEFISPPWHCLCFWSQEGGLFLCASFFPSVPDTTSCSICCRITWGILQSDQQNGNSC